ncbi:MAG: hypothetical protein WC455_15485 [Dehalococcoidia bacterium]|jgi:hypothetical protein
MANVKALVKQSSVARGTEGNFEYIRAINDGSLVTVPWIQSLALEGRIFTANFGSATSPATLDASYAATDPDVSMDIPSGTSIIPLKVAVHFEAYGTIAVCETYTVCSKTLAAKSAGTQVVPANYNTGSAIGSSCLFYTAPTVTDPNTTGSFELFRFLQQNAITQAVNESTDYQFTWSIGDVGFAPVLKGPSSMTTWATSQAATGYIYYVWAEFPSSYLP